MTQLRDLAYVRSGDKGDVVSVGVIAPDKIKTLLGDWVRGPVERHRMDNIHAVIVVLRGGLGGGATSTLRLDQTGKALGNALLRLQVADA